jgi:RNA polymerase sigma-70 factor, ECF subfamily
MGIEDPPTRTSTAEPDRFPPGGVTSIELVRRAQAGDEQALLQLCERYLPILRRWATGRLPPWARALVDTDDIIQDTMIRTLRNVKGFEPRHDGAVAAYLRRALDNRIRDELRNNVRRPAAVEIEEAHPDPRVSPLEEAIGGETLRRYEQALERLSEDDRELVVARIEMGLSYGEVAQATKKPSQDAARVAVGRALLRLASEMKPRARGDES